MTDIITYAGTPIIYFSVNDGVVPETMRKITDAANENFISAVRCSADGEIASLTGGTRQMRAKFRPLTVSLEYSVIRQGKNDFINAVITSRRGKFSARKSACFCFDSETGMLLGKKRKNDANKNIAKNENI